MLRAPDWASLIAVTDSLARWERLSARLTLEDLVSEKLTI
jgi:hypothetical protein